MFAQCLIALSMLYVGSGETSPEKPAPEVLKEYEAAKSQPRRDSTSEVKLALWCESHGLTAEKVRHLAMAVVLNPRDLTARGLLGLVAYHGKWQRPDAITDSLKNDATMAATLAEYNARRASLKNDANAHWRIALWCEEKGLKPEAMAHLTTVIRLDPGRPAAWKRLGFKQHGGRWTTDEHLAAERKERETQRQAEKHWRPLLIKWRDSLSHPKQRADAEQKLAGVDDPRAVPVVWAVFFKGNTQEQLTGVQLLGQIDAPGSSRALAMLAISAEAGVVRQRAIETLKRRDPRDYAGILLSMLNEPIKYEIRKVNGPGSTGTLFVAGKEFNVQRRYTAAQMPTVGMLPGDSLIYDNNGLPAILRPTGHFQMRLDQQALFQQLDAMSSLGQSFLNSSVGHGDHTAGRLLGNILTQEASSEKKNLTNMLNRALPGSRLEQDMQANTMIPVGEMMLAAQKSAALAQQQLDADVQSLDAQNQDINQRNTRVLSVLVPLTGQDFGTDRNAWASWFTDLMGYAAPSTSETPTPTYVEDVPIVAVPAPLPSFAVVPGAIRAVHSCFARGTMVRTLTGPLPIEKIRVGDRALVQDSSTGALDYEPVVAVFHNPPNRTYKLTLDGESVVATGIHRFWKAGQGWTMVRDLNPGDVVRTLDGTARVESVVEAEAQPVFNLEVASGQSFFVGSRGMLVHDNSPVEPVLHPFDAPSALKTQAPPPR